MTKLTVTVAPVTRHVAVTLLLFLWLLALPVSAHHPFGMDESSAFTPLMGLISGIGHPLIGVDHLLFLFSIAFVGITRPLRWLVPLLAVGLAGSLSYQYLNISPLPSWTEVVVALSLSVSGLIALRLLPALLLLPAMFLHGLVLGSAMVGAEPTPLLFYFIGLLVSQSAVLTMSCTILANATKLITFQSRRFLGYTWILLGLVFTYSALMPG